MNNTISIEDLTNGSLESICKLATICDHTFLKRPESYLEQTRIKGQNAIDICSEELNKFLMKTKSFIENRIIPYSLCIRPEYITRVMSWLNFNVPKINNPHIASVVGFPGVDYPIQLTLAETEYVIDNGADEIDMVLNYRLYKSHIDFDTNYKVITGADDAFEQVSKVVNFVHSYNKCSKVKLIIETCELTAEQIADVCHRAEQVGCDFVETSTGFRSKGASVEDLKIIRAEFMRGIKIASHINIFNYEKLLEATSNRDDGMIDLDPNKIRIGESTLLTNLIKYYTNLKI